MLRVMLLLTMLTMMLMMLLLTMMLTVMLLLTMLTMMLMLVLVAAVRANSRGISGQVQFLFTNCDPATARLPACQYHSPPKFNLIFDPQAHF